jgi:hypothetical protein
VRRSSRCDTTARSWRTALGATRALAAATTALVAERAERDKLERATETLDADTVAMSI